jgi:phosphate transport system protein
MVGVAEERLRVAVRALADRNYESLADVTSRDSRINELQIDIDNRCLILIALNQPVAVDLRTIVSVLKTNTDLERVGDLAVSIGQAAQRYLLHPPVKPLIDLPRMAEFALKMLREAIDAFVSRDVSLARPARDTSASNFRLYLRGRRTTEQRSVVALLRHNKSTQESDPFKKFEHLREPRASTSIAD